MAFPNHVEVSHRLVSTSPYALDDNMDASRVISLRFREASPPTFLLLDFPRPLSYFPFVVGPFFVLAVLLPTTDVAAL